MKKLKILDLFSGLGGFSLGLERTGHFRTVAFCDNNKYSKLILDKHWKGIKIYDDVREITKENFETDGIETPDIITGGFPCQPFSVAGKQKGTDDDRHLWPEMFRIIKVFQPKFVIGENVPGIINIQDGVVFETVCTDLEDEGYEVQPFNIPAAAVGAPHQRKRIWFIATHSDYARDRASEYETNEDRQKINEGRQRQSQFESSGYSKDVADTNSGLRRGGEQSNRVEKTKTGSYILRKKNKPENTFGAKLSDAVLFEEKQMWRTPTTMDSKEDSLKHATKLLQGKNLRSTGARIQITLADEVMVEEIKTNPKLMELYKDYEMVTRKNLPEQQEFVEYMREQTSVSELFEKTKIKKTTIEHWFRRDKAGFSHPSVEDWNLIKPHLTTIKYDKEMTTLHSIEWKEDMKMWPTPRASGQENLDTLIKRKGEKAAVQHNLTAAVQKWPTPTARDWKDSGKAVVNSTRHLLPQAVAKNDKEQWIKGGGALNPTWVEWLMGYPAEYTDLKDWAILSSRKSSKK